MNRFKLQDDPTETTGDKANLTELQANHQNNKSMRQQATTAQPMTTTTVTPNVTKEPPFTPFSFPAFTPELYFVILVPPTVLEAAYSLHDSAFLDNLYPILMLAIICKFTSAFFIGYLLVFASKSGYMGSLEQFGDPITNNYTLTLINSLLFSSILTGVDASPVLDILEHASVNKDLFFILLGESLLNDAVTTTMYSAVTILDDDEMDFVKYHYLYLETVGYFFYYFCGGLTIGIIAGIITSIFTRFTAGFRIVEPLVLMCIAFLSYVLSEMINVSGQICMIVCGLIQAHYAFRNISSTSSLTVRYFIKLISSTSDAVIFLFVGLGTLSDITDWHTGFFLWSLGASFVLRFIVVFALIGLYNLLSYRYICFHDQIIISYCGIRGSVCYCLVHMINGDKVGPRELFSTTIITIIIWTALVQGGTMKYLIEVLDIERDKLKTMNEEVHENILSMTMNGIEAISTVHHDSIFLRFFKWIDKKILMQILVNKNLRDSSALRDLSEKLEQDMGRKPIWMMPIPKTPVKEEKRAESPHVKWEVEPQTILNNKAPPFSIRDQPWLPGIPPDQEARSEPWSIRETPWLPGIPTNRQPTHEPFSIREQPWLPGIPLDMPKRRRREALPHDLGDTLREAMRNTPFQRMQYHNARRAVEDSFQNAPPLDTPSDSIPRLNLRRGQVLLEMQEVPGRRQPAVVTSGDLRRRLFVAQMCMPQRRRRSQEPGNRQQTPAAAADALPQRRPSNRSNKS